MKSVKTLAKINNVEIQIVENNREKLIPIKPICEALGINYESQYSKLKEDEFLSSTIVLSPIVAGDGKDREMVCIPLEYSLGWVFNIKEDGEDEQRMKELRETIMQVYHEIYEWIKNLAEFLNQKMDETAELVKSLEAEDEESFNSL